MKTRLVDLPAELIVAITTFQSTPDILRLRATCKILAKICDFPLQDRRTRLYLHPTTVRYAIDLLQDPIWSADITEVIILGSCEPEMKTRDPQHETEFRLDFHPWDQAPAGYEGEVTDSFQMNYKALLDGLQGLSTLRVLKYAGSMACLGLGFCGISDGGIMQHAKSRDSWQSSFGGEGQPKFRDALRTIWWSDAEVFRETLKLLDKKVERVEILQPMAAVDVLRWDLPWENPYGVERDAVRALRITGPGQSGWEDFLGSTFDFFEGLEALEVVIESEIDDDHMRRMRNLPSAGEAILWEEGDTYYKRFGFDVVGRRSKLRRLDIRATTTNHYHLWGILDILHQHEASLKELSLYNVIPLYMNIQGVQGPGNDSPTYDMARGIEDVLEFIKMSMRLNTASMVVPQRGCVNECGDMQHDIACGVYSVLDGFGRVEELNRLAEKLGIELKANTWDFAAHVLE